MGGPQALLGWFLGAVIAIADGMVWSELAAVPCRVGRVVCLFAGLLWSAAVGTILGLHVHFSVDLQRPLEIASGTSP
jgi:hypothetical protein